MSPTQRLFAFPIKLVNSILLHALLYTTVHFNTVILHYKHYQSAIGELYGKTHSLPVNLNISLIFPITFDAQISDDNVTIVPQIHVDNTYANY